MSACNRPAQSSHSPSSSVLRPLSHEPRPTSHAPRTSLLRLIATFSYNLAMPMDPYIAAAVAIGVGSAFAVPAENEDSWNESAASWKPETIEEETPALAPDGLSGEKQVDDGFVWIEGGSFLMGSPESENWRIEDETQHEVTVSGFFIAPARSPRRNTSA